MDFNFKECLAITLVRSDEKIPTIEHVKSESIVLVNDLYGNFNIRLTCILVSYFLYLGTFDIVWLSLHLNPIDITR